MRNHIKLNYPILHVYEQILIVIVDRLEMLRVLFMIKVTISKVHFLFEFKLSTIGRIFSSGRRNTVCVAICLTPSSSKESQRRGLYSVPH